MEILQAVDYEQLFGYYELYMENTLDRQKGRTHFEQQGHSIHIKFLDGKNIIFSIHASGGRNAYLVTFKHLKKKNTYLPKCECPQFEGYKSCKHIAAIALWFDENYPDGLTITNKENGSITIQDSVKNLHPKTWTAEIAPIQLLQYFSLQPAKEIQNRKFDLPANFINDSFQINIPAWYSDHWETEIKYMGDNHFAFHCRCRDPKPCKHFTGLIHYHNINLIQRLIQSQNFEKEKKKAIEESGIPIHYLDRIRFEANILGEVSINKNSLMTISTDNIAMLVNNINYFDTDEKTNVTYISSFRTAIVENNTNNKIQLPYLWKVASKTRKKTKDSFEIVDSKYMNPEFWKYLPEMFRDSIIPVELVQESILRMKPNFHTNSALNQLMNELRKLHIAAKSFWDYACQINELVHVSYVNGTSRKKIEVLKPFPGLAKMEIIYIRHHNYGEIDFNLIYEDQVIPGSSLTEVYRGLYRDDRYLYMLNVEDQMTLALYRPASSQLVLKQALESFDAEILPRLKNRFVVKESLPDLLDDQPDPIPVIHLSSFDQKFIMIRLNFRYFDTEIHWKDKSTRIFVENAEGKTGRINRQPEKEKEFAAQVINYYPEFSKQINRDEFYLSIEAANKNFGFLRFIKHLIDHGYEIYGQDTIPGLKINPNPLKFSIRGGESRGWFEVQANASFGDVKINLNKIAKAIESDESYVLLDDGSLGLLPEEWINKFSLLFKMADKSSADTMRVHPAHVMLLPSDDTIADSGFRDSIRQKQEALSNLEKIKLKKPGSKIKAILRSYQLEGFQWLQQMHHTGFGACLADDMGLGKTLQTICFIDYLLTKEKSGKILVVCPTSLLFNWENELNKFAPHIKFVIHHGTERDFNFDGKFRLLLTSYGTLRNDIDHFNQQEWLYTILDESQAIKNPVAQMTLAVHGLNTKGRLILSGTPVQNNTFDLWSQFQFVNPGLLGSKTFFQEIFSNAIDKRREKTASDQLRKLIHPFILRRTKEQVATDLPEKTETILWCEMAADQRKIYEETREYYKQVISKSIETSGIGKSSFIVLEGMLKLRQLCDSPALLKKPVYNKCSSTKINELLRELEENTGNHKVLVFSQFTEMLAIIRKKLEAVEIKYNYLDGSTTASLRKQQVEEFQSNDDVRVFLISLKAGGVGLNLTQADYVYLIDPWWNPAAEQQAIDRTHRIGQQKPVIAYKMICKDSIEEKILALQSDKKEIAGELIKEDAAMFKKLSKDDIMELFG